jgi:hypothetical protein
MHRRKIAMDRRREAMRNSPQSNSNTQNQPVSPNRNNTQDR